MPSVITFVYLLFSSFALSDHDFHISRTEVNFDSSSKDIQLSIHIYLDDLESALAKAGSKDLHLCSPKESKDGEKAIANYLNSKFVVTVDGKKIEPSWVGKETSKDLLAVWCYQEIHTSGTPKSMTIMNNVLLEMFNDQKNMLEYRVDGKRKSFIVFDHDKTTETFLINK